MAEETQYTAKTAMALVNTANPNLNGTGTLAGIITASSNGTLIKSVSVKAIGNTSNGMVRLFIKRSNSYYLLAEIPINAIRYSASSPAFQTQVILNRRLAPGQTLYASTEVGEAFAVIAECLDWTYYASAVRPDTTQLTANIGKVTISTANSNLDGTGTLGTAYTAGTSATFKGSNIRSITVKALAAVTPGMIRLFIQDLSSNKFLLTELEVDAESQAGTTEAYERTIFFEDDFDIQAGFSVLASTENAESFNVIVEGTDWNYAS